MTEENKQPISWCEASLVVSFDKDIGGKIIAQNPSNITELYGEYFSSQIIFLAFPDRIQVNEIIETKYKIFTFRFPLIHSSIYCHVLFIQIPHIKSRESIQRSLILITKNKEILPYHTLLYQLIPTFKENIFDVSSFLQVLEMKFISFPNYSPGKSVSLKLFGKRFDVTISGKKPFPSLLRNYLRELRSLWVSLLVGDCIVVLGDDVCEVSETVEYLVGLIFPLKYSGEIRPYFTINDPLIHTEKSLIVGVTNKMIPNIIQKNRKITLLDNQNSIYLRHVVDKRFEVVKTMSDTQAGIEVEKEFERNTIEFLSIFDGFFIQKVPKMKTLADPFVTVSYTTQEVINYIKQFHFSSGKEETYILFIHSHSFYRYSTSKISEIEQESLNQLNSLLDSFDMNQYTHKEISKITINLFSLSKLPNASINSKVEHLIKLIVHSTS
ncbi:hypothetical protein EHI8A_051110 [Entamoeba histolytica HM-1:IMSS-B]|uniref:UDENN domain-containing protein n=6 Tax=Entamoeba histolytica TaxID=5759 RepID=C4LWI6_ENTH1|nr:hypothetical protein EHI_096760 [Entamoeba histolytica HM-1:IMSS]EMD49098.1 Hypothetical protein EHI5A_082320 [Entamoeba histolytica KU27]EMH72824.1 hypothetical protein EHI8A_051110 [Entamoeba histolytica HM-1:IMSS-B]EMS12844.1 hypothetical protein KM1_099660 [Entamoeba histolytica HM-3:IMSS]ENY60540.1 hypothetical protein EHI7A_051420 [Entamoeba histolytica HM-1:IMSS-A]GAT93073.1 hypothetical protein CL6EHI_096760 [Entamoeba histolytica]|eukprot:XP_655673.2 hypothetical protein EHI_096760 [Entamoeba histolytica HM-1:IMSS]